MSLDVTVVIPTHPGRERLCGQAVDSVLAQTRQAEAIVVERDVGRAGAAVTRNRGLAKVTTAWVAFLDSDDSFAPEHLEKLVACAERTGADVVYPCPVVLGAPIPRLRFGLPFSEQALRAGNYIPVTVLARTEAVRAAGGFQCPPGSDFEDWGLWLALLDLGARFEHLPEATWMWNRHPGRTEGRPDRW